MSTTKYTIRTYNENGQLIEDDINCFENIKAVEMFISSSGLINIKIHGNNNKTKLLWYELNEKEYITIKREKQEDTQNDYNL